MKNYIPLVLAVLMGLAAVLAVTRMLRKNQQAPESQITVVAASHELKVNDVIDKESLQEKKLPYSARPAESIDWADEAKLVGQTVRRAVRQGDYIFRSDVNLARGMANVVRPGEWAVTINVVNPGVSRLIQPGDEVAILATIPLSLEAPKLDTSTTTPKVNRKVTTVLFPSVVVLDNGTGSARGERGEAGAEIVVSLPPKDAEVVIAAKYLVELSVALRHPNDPSFLKRSDAGQVDETTFEELVKGIKPVQVSDSSEQKTVANQK